MFCGIVGMFRGIVDVLWGYSGVLMCSGLSLGVLVLCMDVLVVFWGSLKWFRYPVLEVSVCLISSLFRLDSLLYFRVCR